MRQGESSRNAYIFVSVSLLLQFAFLLSSSQSLRVVDDIRRSYLELRTEWYEMRLAIVDENHGQTISQAVLAFGNHIDELLGSEAIAASSRLSPALDQASGNLRASWEAAIPLFGRSADQADANRSLRLLATADLEQGLFALEGPVDEMVQSQRRALQVVLYVLAATIAATIGIFWMIERETIHERAVATQIKSLAQSAIGTQEQERARIARALHDSLAQELSLLVLYLGDRGEAPDPERTQEIRDRLVRSVSWLRNLAYELHPAEIEQIGLPAALASYCEELVIRHGVAVRCDVDEAVDYLSADHAINLYRIGQEAITNAIKHSRATRISMSLLDLPDRVLLAVEDDGIGFKTDGERSLGGTRGLGLVGMRERAGLIGGEIAITSAPGAGTRLEFYLPKTDQALSRKEAI